jgi:1-phosphofructokinase family hexose kinase
LKTTLPLLCCGPTPALQRTLSFEDWDSDSDVVRTSSVRYSAGGKATNAARAITCAGGRATVAGFAGGAAGERMKAQVAAEGLNSLWVDTGVETRTCQTLVDAEGRRIRELVENAEAVTLADWETMYERVAEALPRHAGLLLCGSLPATAPAEVYARLVKIAHASGKPVALDAQGAELLSAVKAAPDLVKINRTELKNATGENEVTTGIRALTAHGVGMALITDGPRPAHLQADKTLIRLHLPSLSPVNPIGGGDTVTGVTFWHRVNGAEAVEAACSGLAAGMAQTLTRHPARFDPEMADRLRSGIRREAV